MTLPESGQACATVLALRQALGTAQRRDMLDADLRDAETRLARLPAIIIADPQAETAARLISWATLGGVKLAADDIRMAGIAGMALTPQLAGLVLMLATTLWQSERPKSRPRVWVCRDGVWLGPNHRASICLDPAVGSRGPRFRTAVSSKLSHSSTTCGAHFMRNSAVNDSARLERTDRRDTCDERRCLE